MQKNDSLKTGLALLMWSIAAGVVIGLLMILVSLSGN